MAMGKISRAPVAVQVVKPKRKLGKQTRSEMKKIVKSVIHSEPKYFLTNGTANITFNGVLARLSSVPQSAGASTDTTRIGDQIQPTSLNLSYSFYNIGAPGANPYESDMRVIVFRWLVDDSLVAPTAGLILNSVGGIFSALSTFNHDQRGNFEVLYDKMHLVINSTLNPQNKPVRVNVKVNAKPIEYVAGGTNGLNNIYFLFIGDSDTATDPVMVYYSQLNFKDD